MNALDLGRLIDRYASALTLYARAWCPTPEDVVQDAFLKLATQKVVPRDVVPWLYRVVRNAALDASKGDRRRQRREAAVARPVRWFEESETESQDAEAAQKALNDLPEEQREVIVARLWGGLNFEEIGALVECSASTAFRRFQTGLETLRHHLGVPCPIHSRKP